MVKQDRLIRTFRPAPAVPPLKRMIRKLDTDRLIVRRFQSDDLGPVFAYMSDPRVVKHLPEDLFSETDAIEFIQKNSGSDPENFALIERGSGKLIGHMVFHKWFAPRTLEVGWVIGTQDQGKGYATEAASELLAHGFGARSAHRIIATCQPDNPASWKVMEKIGMRKEGHFRQCIYRRGKWIDEVFYSILSEEWAERTTRSERTSKKKT